MNDLCTDFTVSVVGDGIADSIRSVAPSITIDGAGLPAIAYWAPGKVIMLARCIDLACADSTVTTFGQENTFALVFGAGGLPLLAHHDRLTLSELVVTKCSAAACGAGG
jgi:hypothetical protein